MGQMSSFSGAMRSVLDSMSGSTAVAAKARRAAQVKKMWAEAVEPVFLEHTNSVYIIREGDRKILIVYVDESIFATELNARRELIKLKFLEKFNERLDEFKILVSRGKYRLNYAYKTDEDEPFYIEKATPQRLSAEKLSELESQAAQIPDERVRKSLLKAMISDLEWKMGIDIEKSKNRAL